MIQDEFTAQVKWLKILCLVFCKQKIQNFVSFCLKQATISANGVRKIILIQRLNKIIFLAPLADIFAYFKQKLTKFWDFFYRKQDLTFCCRLWTGAQFETFISDLKSKTFHLLCIYGEII